MLTLHNMNIVIIGTGYVGLVTGVGLASLGNKVTFIDLDEDKIGNLNNKKLTFYEPGLDKYFEDDAKKEDFSVTEISPERSLPQDHYFTDGELSDPWVSISPSTSSTSFSLDFEAFTPIRHMLHKVGENPYSYLFEKI